MKVDLKIIKGIMGSEKGSRSRRERKRIELS